MDKNKKLLEEALAVRYMDLAGINQVNEEIDIEDLYEPVEDAVGGGENIHHDIDHVEVVSDVENVKGVEVEDPRTGEVSITDIDIERIAEAVRIKIKENLLFQD